MKILILILLAFFFLACQNESTNLSESNNNESYADYRKDGLKKDEFWGKGENSDIPNVFESVFVDENGKENGKGGDTHFHFLDKEVFVSYQIYDSPEIALKQLHEAVENAEKIIRKGIILNNSNEEVGQKVLLIKTSENLQNNQSYSLIWTRNARFTSLSSESLKAIEAYEKDRNL